MPVIILAWHGAPPIDFPTNETVEMFNLPARLEHSREGKVSHTRALRTIGGEDACLASYSGKRSIHPGSIDIARNPQEVAQQDVILGFNEF